MGTISAMSKQSARTTGVRAQKGSQLIVMIGTVGAGKSTQSRLLALELEKWGVPVRLAWLKTGHLLAYLLGLGLTKTLRTGAKAPGIGSLLMERPTEFRRLFRLWTFLDLVSITAKFMSEVYFPLKLGYTVIVEEFTPGILSDYVFFADTLGIPIRHLDHFFAVMYGLSHQAGPASVFFLDAGAEALESRWSRRGKTPGESILPFPTAEKRVKYTMMQRTLLPAIAQSVFPSVTRINTGDMNKSETLGLLASLLGTKTPVSPPNRAA
jgi:hypothetical protein